MKKYFSLFLPLFLLISQTAVAQNAQGCDGSRYYYDVFSEISKTTESYGENETAAGNSVNLKMNIYQPVGDNLEKRPLLIWAHGGAFVTGDRAEMDTLCYLFAKKGFVTASMSYRLYPVLQLGIPDSLGMLDAAMRAVGDMKAAIRHFRKDAATENKYRIDPEFIYVGGVSAGAIMAVQVAYLDSLDIFPDYFADILAVNGGLEGNTGDAANQMYSSAVNGVINLAGAIHKLDWIQEDGVPIISYHGDADDVVPYEHGLASVLGFDFMSLNGSGSIHNYIGPFGIPNFLVTAPGADHSTAFGSDYESYLETFIEDGLVFLYNLLCEGVAIPVNELLQNKLIKVWPNPSDHIITMDVSSLKEPYDVVVYDLAGRQVFFAALQEARSFQLSKAQVGQGLFFVRLQTADGALVQCAVFE